MVSAGFRFLLPAGAAASVCLATACSVIVDNNLKEEGSCSTNSECDDGDPCNGLETCGGDGLCAPGASSPADGTECELPGLPSERAICLDESCGRSVCGDGFLDTVAGETCDDGADGDDRDGCTDECAASCINDVDCDDGDPCDGVETCSMTSGCLEATMCLAPTTSCRTPADEPGQCGDCRCEAL